MKLLPYVAYLFLRTLRLTLWIRHARVRHVEENRHHILAFWHECIAFALHSRWSDPTAALNSRSRDGDIASRVVELYGVQAIRGSSSRGGGSALRELIRRAQQGVNVGLTPDGPRGPRRVAKSGIVRIAQATRLPIIAFYFTARRKKRLRSWDQTIIPLPFTRALFLYSDPITVPPDGEVEEWRQKVERVLNDLADEAERDFDALWKSGR